MPHATVGALITGKLDEKTCILLTKRNIEPFRGKWCLPGGHIEPFETAKDAVIREVKEETDMDFMPDFFMYQDEILCEHKIHNVALFFRGEASSHPRADKTEVSEISWFTLEEALTMDLAFLHRKVLEAFHVTCRRTTRDG